MTWLFTNTHLDPRPMGHLADQYLEFARALDVPAEPMIWDLGPRDDEREWQRTFYARLDRPAALLVLGTSKPEKDWIADRWARVADALYTDFGLQPVLIGGRSARELATEMDIRRLASHAPTSALGSGIRTLVPLIDGARLVISPDTGPLHIAVALDRPVISLIGYTNPKRSGPYRRFLDLMIDAYGDPGENYPPSDKRRPGHMARIQVDDVLEKVERAMAR
jgi:heptosyltransferase I